MKYICEYPSIPDDNKREYSLSTVNKVNYIVSVLNQIGEKIEIISPAICKGKKACRGNRCNVSNDLTIILSPSIPHKTKLGYYLSHFFTKIWMLFFLLKNCKKGEIVFSYHGIIKIPFIKIAIRLKKIRIVLEVEEIYSKTNNKANNTMRFNLEKSMIAKSSAYIFASKELATNYSSGKPFVIATGAYTLSKRVVERLNDSKIHIVYAGLIQKDKAAFRCLKMAKYLNNKYVLHIIGYGDYDSIELLNDRIIKESYGCRVVFDGIKNGEDYIKYLQQCHIGLCPLDDDKEFQNACFPSKITSYISNGLLVLTTKNEVLENSVYSPLIVFSDPTPEAFANKIKSINYKYDDSNGRKIVRELDQNFKNDILRMLNDIRK